MSEEFFAQLQRQQDEALAQFEERVKQEQLSEQELIEKRKNFLIQLDQKRSVAEEEAELKRVEQMRQFEHEREDYGRKVEQEKNEERRTKKNRRKRLGR